MFQAQLEVLQIQNQNHFSLTNMQSIRRLRIKFIRKLGRARSRVALNIVKKRDIIADYSDPGSQVWFGFPAATTDFRRDY